MRLKPYVALAVSLLKTVRNWPLYVSNRLFPLTRETITFHLRNGMRVVCRPYRLDRAAFNDVWLDESYNPHHFDISFAWNDCKQIVDIGANIGNFTLFAAWKAPHARIIAVEPEPGNVAMSQKNIDANHLSSRVTLIAAGIAATEGTGTLHLSAKESGGHSLYAHGDTTRTTTVSLKPLATILKEQHMTQIDFLKLDCEGGEYEGLYALSQAQLDGISFIAVEYHHFSSDPAHTPERLRSFLEQHGFTVTSPKKSIFFAHR